MIGCLLRVTGTEPSDFQILQTDEEQDQNMFSSNTMPDDALRSNPWFSVMGQSIMDIIEVQNLEY